MTTSSEELNTYLKENSVPYDNDTELICINDMSKGGLPYYIPEEFNEHYLNYIYERINDENLNTETTNYCQCQNIPNAIYLDGDWYFNKDVEPEDYTPLCMKIAKSYKNKWENELNTETVSFVFIPESFDHRKGGFHVFIFTKENISKNARMEIYTRIKDTFAQEVVEKYVNAFEVKSSEGFVPVSESNYETLFDRGPTINMNTLLPFAEKYKATRRYRLDTKHSSDCILNCNIPFFLNGVIYPERSEIDNEELSLETFDENLEKNLETRYMDLISRTKDELSIFGKKYGRQFAEFMRSLIYLSPNHRFWKIMSNHDDRLRYIFSPFMKITCLSYFIENDGEIPNEDDLTLAAAKLIQPLLKTVARDMSGEKLTKYNFQYTVKQMRVAYEQFAHIQQKFTEKESEVYRSFALDISSKKDKEEDNDMSEENTELQILEKELTRLETQLKALKAEKAKSLKAEKTKSDYENKQTQSIIKELRRSDYNDEDLRREELNKNSKIREISRDDSKSSDEKDEEKDEVEQEFSIFKTNYIKNKISSYEQDMNKTKSEYEDAIKKIAEKYANDEATIKQEIDKTKREKREVEKSRKNKLSNEKQKIFDKLQNLMIDWINSWMDFVIDLIMQHMTDEIKPFRSHNVNNPYAYTEDGLPNREAISFADLKPRNSNNPSSKSFYNEVLRTWTRHFLFATFYDSRSSDDAICTTMTHLIKDFIYINNDEDNHETFIYNFQQTEELADYHFQQWILDDSEKNSKKLIGTRTTLWVKNLYNTVIKPELSTRHIKKYLLPLTELVKKCRVIVGNYYPDKELAPFPNYDKGITSICNNLASFVQTAYVRKPIPISVSDVVSEETTKQEQRHTTFGRNGRIWFDQDGNIHYELKDNHAFYSTGQTNIIFDENYDKDNDNYRTVEKIFKITFPIPEHRVFIERLIASTFVGGLHDVFVIMYGTGGEGKSVFCNLILAMMGSESIGRKSLKELRRNKQSKIINPHGLGGTVKSSILLVSNTGGHDEDGMIHTKDKRFIIMQEPAKRNSQCVIHTDIIKEMTSGTETSARGIFGKQQSFIINTLPVLQTNVLPSFDTDDKAVHRRVVVIPMRAKFYSNVNKEREKCQYSAKADSSLPIRIETDAYLVQAVFYYLLPTITEVIRNKWIPTSNIPRPSDIMTFTDNVFKNTTGIAGWLGERINKDNRSCVFVSDIIDKANEYQDVNSKDGVNILGKDKSKRSKEIIEAMIQKYESALYRYKDEYYNKTGRPKDSLKTKVINMSIEEGAELAQQKYMNEFPINVASDSRRERVRKGKRYDDIVLVGYRYDEVEDIDKNEDSDEDGDEVSDEVSDENSDED